MNDAFNIQAARFLSGELKPSEHEKFIAQLNNDNELNKEFQIMAQYWQKMNKKETNQFDSEEAWNKLESRIANSNDEKRKKNIKVPKMGIAAAIILAFGLLTLMLAYFLPGHNQIRYTADSRMQITLPDKSTVILKKGSQLTLDERFNKKTRTTNLKGQAWFVVSPNSEKPFIIEAARSSIKVVGTSFSVDSRPNKPDLIVVKTGKVEVNHKYTDEILMLGANELAEASENRLYTISNIRPNYLSWALRDFYFSNATLEGVARELEQAFGKNVAFVDSSIGKLQISATFENQSLNEIIDIISETHNLQYSIAGDNVVLKHRN